MSKSGNRGPALPEGTGYCWGHNTEQQLGTSGSAQYISGEFDLTSSLSAGGDTTCGRWRAGTTGSYQLKCWGSPFAGSTAGTLVTITNAPSGSVSVGHSVACDSPTYPAVPSFCFGSTANGQTAIGMTPLVGGMTTAYPANY